MPAPIRKQAVPGNVILNPSPPAVMDHVLDGQSYSKVTNDALTGNKIDPSKSGVLTRGSVPPSVSGGFVYVATTTVLTFYWDGTNGSTPISILRADGTATGPLSGSQGVSGLSPGTIYYFYPFYSESAKQIEWVGGGVGSPAYAHSSKTNLSAQAQSLQGNVPLSSGSIQAATMVSGGGGGSGGGSGVCLRQGMLVMTWGRGAQRIEECRVGELIEGRTRWTRIGQMELLPQSVFVRVETKGDDAIEVAPTHPFTLADETEKSAEDLTLSDHIIHRAGAVGISRLESKLYPGGKKVRVTCLPEHEFWAGEAEPNILAHNLIILS